MTTMSALKSDPSPKSVPNNPILREVVLLRRLNIHNVWIAALPAILFASAAWASVEPARHSAYRFTLAVIWAYLFIYVFDTANQAVGADEDRVNKPKRPIPAGLTTPRGLWNRFAVGSWLFLVLAQLAGPQTFWFTLLWLTTILVVHCWMPQRLYFVWKPISTWLGVVAQLGGSWSIVSTVSAQVWAWIIIIATMFVAAMAIEDVRDVDGDRITGRRSLPMIFGVRRVCLAFCFLMLCWPVLAVRLLLRPDGLVTSAEIAVTAVLAGLCFIAIACAAQTSSRAAQKAAYIAYSFVHIGLCAFPLAYVVSQHVSV